MHKTKIIFLPFAGGSQSSYIPFRKAIGDSFEVVLPELPGRGIRSNESLLTNIHHMVDDIYLQVFHMLNTPFAIYGHSMGTLLGVLLVRKLVQRKLPMPIHLFFTGAPGPSARNTEPPRYNLPRQQFIGKLKELDGSPQEVLEDEELMRYFMPILRADFQAVETYSYEASSPFSIPITVMTGSQENISSEQLMAWKKETAEPVEFHQFEGKHFFLFQHIPSISQIISNNISHTV